MTGKIHFGKITALEQFGHHSSSGTLLEASKMTDAVGREFSFDPDNVIVDHKHTDDIEELKSWGITVGSLVQFMLSGPKGNERVNGFLYPIYFNPAP
jgi:hypothetical protein